jgi:hypothetical protein
MTDNTKEKVKQLNNDKQNITQKLKIKQQEAH